MVVYLECNLCRGAAVEPVLNRCGHLFCGPCLRREFRRHPHGSSRCPACGRRASPSRLTPIYGQQSSSEPGHESGGACALADGCPAGWADVDMIDEDGAEADVVMMDIDGGATEAYRAVPGCVDPMEIDGGADNQVVEEEDDDDEVKKMVHLECSICLDEAEEPVATLCGHIYCCPCLFQWLDGRRRKCPVCKKAASESTVTLVLPAPQDGAEKRHNSVG